MPVRLSDDERGVVRGDGHPVGKRQIVGDHSGASDPAVTKATNPGARVTGGRPSSEVEIDVVDVGVAAAVDHDVVAAVRRQRRQVGIPESACRPPTAEAAPAGCSTSAPIPRLLAGPAGSRNTLATTVFEHDLDGTRGVESCGSARPSNPPPTAARRANAATPAAPDRLSPCPYRVPHHRVQRLFQPLPSIDARAFGCGIVADRGDGNDGEGVAKDSQQNANRKCADRALARPGTLPRCLRSPGRLSARGWTGLPPRASCSPEPMPPRRCAHRRGDRCSPVATRRATGSSAWPTTAGNTAPECGPFRTYCPNQVGTQLFSVCSTRRPTRNGWATTNSTCRTPTANTWWTRPSGGCGRTPRHVPDNHSC